MRRLWFAMMLLVACGGGLPPRFVLEREIGSWSYRRYQRVLDVEVPVEGNTAVGHTATYVRRNGARGGRVPFATVFVSVYDHPQGLAAELRRVARSLGTYEVEMRPIGGGWVWHLDGGAGDRWALWVSQNHIVKVGASEEEDRVPDDLVATYMGMYPSDLDEHGRARGGALSAGDPTTQAEPSQQQGGPQVPSFLQQDAPR
jgi:hypothetical protein